MTIMSPEDTLRIKLQALVSEHRVLNARVDELTSRGFVPSLDLARLKKQKLALRDQINALRNRIEPNIIA
ncbi:MAG: YdcH family protein [Neomegalonema sp.]|nr:YdcH family protein [Neomegalonema sp.]